jgi:hypothetical protein
MGTIDGSAAALIAAAIAGIVTVYLFLLQPAAKEDANRCALHELEVFCPPNWNSKSVEEINKALSSLYKELQYASRGKSFIITRAAAWEMKKILKSKSNPGDMLNEEESQKLYVWKTLIAILLSKKSLVPNFTGFQKAFRGKLRRAIRHTRWVLAAYDHMNGTELSGHFLMLKKFKEDLSKAPRNPKFPKEFKNQEA